MLGSGSSIQLARVFGIRIGVNASWFLILFLIIYLLQQSYSDALGPDEDNLAFIGGVLGAALYFISIALHELGHALAARRVGIQVDGIDLFFFGGVMKMSRDTDTPGREFLVAAAGPAVTLVIALAAYAVGVVALDTEEFRDAVGFRSSDSLPVLLVSLVVSLNALLFLFNMIPAFPLDGGRLARALVWRITGSRGKATRVSAAAGQLFAGAMIVFGVYLAMSDDVFNGVWLAVLGFLLGQSARAAVLTTAVTDRIEGVRVADVMDHEPVVIPAHIPVMEAFENYFLRYVGWSWFAVVEDDGRFVGLAHRAAVEHAAVAEASTMPVREVVAAGQAAAESIGVDAPLEAVLGSEALRRLGALMAVDAEGRLRGVLTVEQVARALNTRPVGA